MVHLYDKRNKPARRWYCSVQRDDRGIVPRNLSGSALLRISADAGNAFDSGRGDLFVCRLAGNFANSDTIASMEYAVAMLGTPLIMVLGHDACGAVDATIKSLKDNTTLPGHLPSLVASLTPAVKAASGKPGDALDNAIRQNVIDNVAKLKSAAPILSSAVEQRKLKVVGGIYRLRDGRVEMIS